VVIAYGTAARIAKGAVKKLRNDGLKVGLARPITLWPFPNVALQEMTSHVKDFLVFEMSTGQMLEDVRLAIQNQCNIHFYGRPGGIISTPDEIAGQIRNIYNQENDKE
jgi:2-oxoglutarate ferredoxin oxidoreductase subunit alpha